VLEGRRNNYIAGGGLMSNAKKTATEKKTHQKKPKFTWMKVGTQIPGKKRIQGPSEKDSGEGNNEIKVRNANPASLSGHLVRISNQKIRIGASPRENLTSVSTLFVDNQRQRGHLCHSLKP